MWCFLFFGGRGGGMEVPNFRSHWHTNMVLHLILICQDAFFFKKKKKEKWQVLGVQQERAFIFQLYSDPKLIWHQRKKPYFMYCCGIRKHSKCRCHLCLWPVLCAVPITETHLGICLPKPEPSRWFWFHPATKWNHVGAVVLPHLAAFIDISTAASNQANTGPHHGRTQMETLQWLLGRREGGQMVLEAVLYIIYVMFSPHRI